MRCLLILLCFSPLLVAAQSACDPSVEPSLEKSAIRYQHRGNRCEGFYKSKVSAASLELIAFTLGDLRFKNEKGESITLRTPTAGSKTVQIRAQGIPRNLYYRMDASLQGGQNLSWEADPVLLRDDGSSRAYNIGLLAFQGEGSQRVFFPVLSQSKQLGTGTGIDSLTLQFMGSARIASFKYQIDQGATKALKTPFPEGRPIRIRLNPALPKGQRVLTVTYRAENDTTVVTRKYYLQL
jgi:hypothetical protein